MSDTELTPEAKGAIRAYMFRIIVPSGVALTIVSGLLGFVVSGVARLDASATSAADARVAASDAIKASVEAKSSNFRAAEAAQKAESAQIALAKVKEQTDKILTGQYESFVTALFATPGFRDALGKFPEQQAVDINKRLESLYSGLSSWSNVVMERGNASETTMDRQFDNPPYGIRAECQTPGST